MVNRQKHQAQAVENENTPSAGIAAEVAMACPEHGVVTATIMDSFIPGWAWCQEGSHAIRMPEEENSGESGKNEESKDGVGHLMVQGNLSNQENHSQDGPGDREEPPQGGAPQSQERSQATAPRAQNSRAPASKPSTAASKPQSGMDLGRSLLKQFETASAFERLEGQISAIEELEGFIADDRGKMVAAQTAADGVKTTLTLAGLEGKNETERKAALENACQDDGLYMRAMQELDEARMRIDVHEASASAGRRRFTAIRLEIEARISSKQLMASVLGTDS